MTDDATQNETPQEPEKAPAPPLSADLSSGGEIRSIDDLDPASRDFLERHTKKVVNEAREAWAAKAPQEQPRSEPQNAVPEAGRQTSDKTVSLSELERILADRDRQYQREAAARDRLQRTLTDMGIREGDERYAKVAEYYMEQKEKGALDATVLTSEAGIRSLVFASGAAQPEAPNNQTEYYYKTTGHDELNKRGEKYILDERQAMSGKDRAVREFMEERMREARGG